MAEHIETIIIGGGQTGLSTSCLLTQQGREHIVFERRRVGEAWRSGRWDSFTLVTPNCLTNLPAFAYKGNDPNGFMPRQGIVDYLEAYAASFNAPVRTGVEVTAVDRLEDGTYHVTTSEGSYERSYIANNVVVAAGAYQAPRLPTWSVGLSGGILQMHTGQYRNPDALPEGAVLVIGTGQSGCQIAEELYKSGREVYLSVGSAGRVPRRYRGIDCAVWFARTGFFERTPDKLPTPVARYAGNPHVTGKGGGHSLNLHRFAEEGVTLLGRIQAAESGVISIAPDLTEKLGMADGFSAMVLKMIDEFITNNGLDVAEDPVTRSEELRQWNTPPLISELDLRAARVGTVIWANGYSANFNWVHLPVFGEHGLPREQISTGYRGLYFLGIPFLPKQKSSLLYGVGEDAERVSSDIVERAHAGTGKVPPLSAALA